MSVGGVSVNKQNNFFAYYINIPALALNIACAAFGVIAVSLLAGILLIPRLVHDRNQIAVVIQSLYRGNFTLYGIPFSQLLGGAGAAAAASAIAAATLPVLNIAAVVMYAWYAGRERRNWVQLLKGILKNPILWGVFLGLAFRPFHAALPGPLESLTASLAAMASPLAFLTLGTKLYGGRVPAEQRKLTGAVVLYKLLIMPVLVLPVAIWGFGLRGPELIPVFLFAAAPSVITTYQLAGEYGADDLLAEAIRLKKQGKVSHQLLCREDLSVKRLLWYIKSHLNYYRKTAKYYGNKSLRG